MSSSNTTPGPLPSKHVFIHELSKQPSGTKVRFLGCVTSYDIPTGLLVLEHAFPRDAPRVPRVQVDVTLTLESLSADELSDGSWVNVIGYVRTLAPRRRRRNNTAGQAEASTVQAVLLWSAGAVRIADYQGALSRQQELAKQLQTASPELLA